MGESAAAGRVWRLRLLAALAVLAVGGISTAAQACSCGTDSTLRASLERAGRSAQVIFRGRVRTIHLSRVAVFEVLETLKGAAKASRWVWTAKETMGCTFSFEVGREYLVYGWEGTVALNTSFCTRTGPIEEAAFDLEYLRHGTLPSPDTLRRGVVECPWDLEDALASIGLPQTYPSAEYARLMDAGLPFLGYATIAPGFVERSVLGVDRDGGAFELRIVPAFGLCAKRVLRHRCTQLQLDGQALVCLGAERDELLFDERHGRTGRWLPAESEWHSSCEWLRGDTGMCRLSELTASGPEAAAGDGGTVLWCYPRERGDRETNFDCRLHRASEPPDGGPDER